MERLLVGLIAAIFAIVGGGAVAIVIALLAIPLVIWRSFVIATLWFWFVVPIFPETASYVTTLTVAGFLYIYGLITLKPVDIRKIKDEDKIDYPYGVQLFLSIASPAAVLLAGYIIKFYLM